MNNRVEQPQLEGMPPPPESHIIASVKALAVKIVHPFAAVKDIRYYLCGVNIRPLPGRGAMLVATDGHRFIIVRDENATVERELTIRVHKDALKYLNLSTNSLEVLSTGEAKVHDENGIAVYLQPGNCIIDGHEFPRIENVVNLAGYVEGISGGMNPAYLAAALEVGDFFAGVRFFTRDADSPLLFVYSGIGLDCFGGIMKLRDSFESLPSWFPERTAPRTLAEV
jgi:hypothetical protein